MQKEIKKLEAKGLAVHQRDHQVVTVTCKPMPLIPATIRSVLDQENLAKVIDLYRKSKKQVVVRVGAQWWNKKPSWVTDDSTTELAAKRAQIVDNNRPEKSQNESIEESVHCKGRVCSPFLYSVNMYNLL